MISKHIILIDFIIKKYVNYIPELSRIGKNSIHSINENNQSNILFALNQSISVGMIKLFLI